MKKRVVIVLVLIVAMLAFVACGDTAQPPQGNGEEPGGMKTGLAVMTSAGKSQDAGEENGVAQVDSIVVAVLVDESGIIQNCAIDSAQTEIEFDTEGKIVTPLDTVFLAKQELGDAYGLKGSSAIGKEWNEQANAFANYVIGKTVEDVKGIALTDEGDAADEDLASSVTIRLPGFIDAIEKAVANAEASGAASDDLIGIGIVTTIDKSENVGEEDGFAQAYSNYAVVTFDEESGVITSCIIDGSQTDIAFDSSGKITTDLAGPFLTKNELGDAYGMIEASTIGKEWYEQAEAFSQYVVGKTVEEVNGIALTDEGLVADEDLASSVTIHVGPFMANIEKAAMFAR